MTQAKLPEAGSTHSRSASNTPISPRPPSLPPIPRVASVYNAENEQPASQQVISTRGDGRMPEAGEPKSYQPQREDVPNQRFEQRDFQPLTYRPREEFHVRRTSQEERESYQSRRPNTAGDRPVTGLRSRGQTAYQPTQAQPSDFEARTGTNLRIHPVISPPTAPVPQLENLSPSKFPSESHRAPPMPPQLLPTSHSPRQPSVHVLPLQKIEKQEKHGKKLNLRNPMSLLLRRRSGQVLEHLSDESLITHRTPGVHGYSMGYDFDPSIRGKIVHDFSAPRPRRNFSAPGGSGEPSTSGLYGSSAQSSNERLHSEGNDSYRAERQHTPVFKEHFEDDGDQQKNDSAIRAETLANKDFIARNSFPPPGQDMMALPAFTRLSKPLPEPPQPSPPSELPIVEAPPPPQQADTVVNATPLSPLAEEGASSTDSTAPRTTSTARPRQRKTPSSASRSTISMRGSRTSTRYDWQTAGLPAHMLSNSSRFSFQLANASAAQERLLEERHKQKEAAKALERANRRVAGEESEEEEDYDFDDMDDGGYDGFEEEVPTVGEGWGNAGLGLSGLTLGTTGLSLQEAAKMALGSNPVHQFGGMPVLPPPAAQGLGILPTLPEQVPRPGDPQKQESASQEAQTSAQSRAAVGSQFVDDNDDLYFDDGEFADIDIDLDGTEPFDESVFDDPNHHLYERKPVHRPEPSEDTKDGASTHTDEPQPVVPQNSQRATRQSRLGLVPSEPMPQHPDVNANQETISAYHQALASAANRAAADGRFRRQSSVDISEADLANLAQSTLSAPHTDEDDSGVPNLSSRPSLVPDDSKHNSQATSGFSPIADQLDGAVGGFGRKSVGFALPNMYDDGFGYSSDFDCSDYDSALDDDPIIAAANAEALENDDEGIYGHEFGFYAKPAPATLNDGEAVFYQGGYFGPKEWSEVKRQRSTREPNLTPITERSEYSTRNSYVSLHMPDHRASGDRGQPSPGLAALARMSPGWESDNMETLMKLRRAAFGGSQGSLVSGGNASSPMNSSPVVGKGDPRALWSSPISRELSGEGGIEEEDLDPDMLEEANYADDDEEEEDGIVDLDRVVAAAEDVSPTSNYSEESDQEFDGEPTQRSALDRAESPTIRASLAPPFSIPSSPSPKSQLRSSPLPPPSSSPTTASTSLPSNTTTTTPFLPPLSPPASSKPAFSAPFTPISPVTTNFGPSSPPAPTSPVSPGGERRGHSRSGSDSVAYVRERDQEGLGFRWVLERRRTAEDGGVEIVGREVVQGGRI